MRLHERQKSGPEHAGAVIGTRSGDPGDGFISARCLWRAGMPYVKRVIGPNGIEQYRIAESPVHWNVTNMHSRSQLCKILSMLVFQEWYGLLWFIIPYFVNHESRYGAVAHVELVMLRINALQDDLCYVNLSLHRELTDSICVRCWHKVDSTRICGTERSLRCSNMRLGLQV